MSAAQESQPQSSVADALRDYCRRVVNDTPMPEHHRMMARAKAEELVFWVRAGAQRGEV